MSYGRDQYANAAAYPAAAWYPTYHPGMMPQQGNPMGGHGGNRKYDTGELSKTNVYISGLKPNTTDDDLKSWCQSFGTIVSAKAIVDRETGQCKGYGFVMFEAEQAARSAVDALVRRGAQATFAKVTKPQSEQQQGGRQEDPTNLYITNLPKEMDEAGVTGLLTEAAGPSGGSIVSCRVLRDQAGAARGIALVRMDSKQSCERMINALNGRTNPGCAEPMTVKFANTPSNRRNNNNRYQQRPNMYNPNQGDMHFGMQQQMMPGVNPYMAQPYMGVNGYNAM